MAPEAPSFLLQTGDVSVLHGFEGESSAVREGAAACSQRPGNAVKRPPIRFALPSRHVGEAERAWGARVFHGSGVHQCMHVDSLFFAFFSASSFILDCCSAFVMHTLTAYSISVL